jgi:hypothetical protein
MRNSVSIFRPENEVNRQDSRLTQASVQQLVMLCSRRSTSSKESLWIHLVALFGLGLFSSFKYNGRIGFIDSV